MLFQNDNQTQQINQSVDKKDSLSQTLFLQLVKYLIYLFILLTLLSIPLFVGTIQITVLYWKHTKNPFTMNELTMMGSMIALKRNISLCKISNSSQFFILNQIHTNIQLSSTHIKCQHWSNILFNFFGCQITIATYQLWSLRYNLFLKAILLICAFLVQYRSHILKKNTKTRYIQNFTIEIGNLPKIPVYQLIYQLQQYIKKQNNQFDIFDCEPSFSQEELSHQLLLRKQNHIHNCEQFGGQLRLKQLQLSIKQSQILNKYITNSFTNTVWITFMTRRERYFALQTFRMNQDNFVLNLCKKHEKPKQFLGHNITLKKAPHPTQILWNNLYQPECKRVMFKIICINLSVLCIVGFDWVILAVEQIDLPVLVTPMIVMALESILKLIIDTLSEHERHILKSQIELSTLRKLGMLIFISSFDLGPLSLIISSRKYHYASQQWYHQVIPTVIVIFIIQIVYVNLRLYLQFLQHLVVQFVQNYWNSNLLLCMQSVQQYKQSYHKPEIYLGLCYSHVLSVYMIGITYSYNYILMNALLIVYSQCVYISHTRYMRFYCKQAPYNNDRLDQYAIKLLYISVLVHLLMTFLTQAYQPALIMLIVCLFGYVIRWFIAQQIIQVIRGLFGPILYNWQSQSILQSQHTHLYTLLSRQQINIKIQQLAQRQQYIEQKYMYKITKKQHKHLMKYIQTLQNTINQLESLLAERNLTSSSNKQPNHLRSTISFSTSKINNQI